MAPGEDGTLVAAFCVLGRTFMRSIDAVSRGGSCVMEIGEQAKVIVVGHARGATSQIFDGIIWPVSMFAKHARVPNGGRAAAGHDVHFRCRHDGAATASSAAVDRVWHTLDFVPTAFNVASGRPRLSGAIVEIDPATGHALGSAYKEKHHLEQTWPKNERLKNTRKKMGQKIMQWALLDSPRTIFCPHFLVFLAPFWLATVLSRSPALKPPFTAADQEKCVPHW